MSGFKLFAIMVAAILTCAAVIGVILKINAAYQQRQNVELNLMTPTNPMDQSLEQVLRHPEIIKAEYPGCAPPATTLAQAAAFEYASLMLERRLSLRFRRNSPADKLYREWEKSASVGTTEEQRARLDDCVCKLKDVVKEPDYIHDWLACMCSALKTKKD